MKINETKTLAFGNSVVSKGDGLFSGRKAIHTLCIIYQSIIFAAFFNVMYTLQMCTETRRRRFTARYLSALKYLALCFSSLRLLRILDWILRSTCIDCYCDCRMHSMVLMSRWCSSPATFLRSGITDNTHLCSLQKYLNRQENSSVLVVTVVAGCTMYVSGSHLFPIYVLKKIGNLTKDRTGIYSILVCIEK